MIPEKCLVVYKNRPALVTGTGEKIEILLLGEGDKKLRVREKDIELLHPGPLKDTGSFGEDIPGGDVRGVWELLEGAEVPLKDLAELVYGQYTPRTAWAAYLLLKDGLYFSGGIQAVTARPAPELEAEEKKRTEKQRETGEREALLALLRAKKLQFSGDAPVREGTGGGAEPAGPEPEQGREEPPGGTLFNEGQVRKFLQDVEALVYGKTDKSRTLRDLGRPETPEEAHRLFLETGLWTVRVNPHPARFGLSPVSAPVLPDPPPEEERLDLTRLKAYAIDNAWSDDPDDAISLEDFGPEGPRVLWVHVADPGASILPDSPADREARNRGATLYLPEGASRMIAGEALPLYALGLGESSPALSFKMVLNQDFSVAETDIIPSRVRVTRLSYAEADSEQYAPELGGLFALAQANLAWRTAAGAVSIDLPEVHIVLTPEKVSIEPLGAFRSADMVRECMLLAGEEAGRWALRKGLPFPYISQETGDLPKTPLPGLAGSYQLRRCMRPRSLSVKPGLHAGLGLDVYTQVTSPLRRYTDLLAHQQIRALLRGGLPLGEEEVLLRIAAAEAAASATVQAERASRAHWTAVYLSDKRGSEWEGVLAEKRGGRGVVLIPALGLETQVPLKGDPEPNDPVSLILTAVRIPEAEAVFREK
ncbi:MAG: RNB domain-containing ribonuclease [Treponema sp.]|jgi:exoribonuclease-2|nr:RNB domain-containing ribonuclease [Treponema sp.]